MEKQCCLCGKEGEEVKEISRSGGTLQVFACDDCAVDAISEVYFRRNKGPWYKAKMNWGFWILVGGFLAFLITWFIIRPNLGVGIE